MKNAPDWSKAPEDATHWSGPWSGPDSDEFLAAWIKDLDSEDGPMAWLDDGEDSSWGYIDHQDIGGVLIPRPVFSEFSATVNGMAAKIHELNRQWWQDPSTGQPIERNRGELIALIHSELSEALEADRNNLMDDKLPHRNGLEVELADAMIRILDMAGGLGLDLGGALAEKLAYNQQRADHKPENRLKDGGKKY
jgi:NTP pyrophosphatase (non-canonical NTP hydrolase)